MARMPAGRLLPPQLTTNLYVPSPSHYVNDHAANPVDPPAGASPGPGAGSVRPYSLPTPDKGAGMFTQPARVVSPPQRSVHSEPSFNEEIGNIVGSQTRQAMGNSFPTFIPGVQRAAASNIGIETPSQGNYMLVIAPDRYNALTARIRQSRDVRGGILANKFSRRRAQAPSVGA